MEISAELRRDSLKNGLFGRVFHTLYHKSGYNGILEGFQTFQTLMGEMGGSFFAVLGFMENFSRIGSR